MTIQVIDCRAPADTPLLDLPLGDLQRRLERLSARADSGKPVWDLVFGADSHLLLGFDSLLLGNRDAWRVDSLGEIGAWFAGAARPGCAAPVVGPMQRKAIGFVDWEVGGLDGETWARQGEIDAFNAGVRAALQCRRAA